MRQIKFRAWNTRLKRFISWSEYHFWVDPTNGNPQSGEGMEIYGDDNELLLQQYSECKDRSGEEIYEGDIVSYMEDLTNPKEVYFDKGVFWPLATFNTETAVTVLGNVFENSDLLNNNEE